jgi:hypothetical protein
LAEKKKVFETLMSEVLSMLYGFHILILWGTQLLSISPYMGLGGVVHACNPSTEETSERISSLSQILSRKTKTKKKKTKKQKNKAN